MAVRSGAKMGAIFVRPATRVIPMLILCAVAGQAQQGGYRQDSLDSDQLQPIYAKDVQDPWNRVFHYLFTQTVRLRLTEDFPEGAPFHPAQAGAFPGLSGLKISDRTFERIESGDRGIEPLYPSFFDSRGTRRPFTEPRYSESRTHCELH